MYFKIKQNCHCLEKWPRKLGSTKFVFPVFVPLLVNLILFQFCSLYLVDIFFYSLFKNQPLEVS